MPWAPPWATLLPGHRYPGFLVNHAGRAFGTEALRVLVK